MTMDAPDSIGFLFGFLRPQFLLWAGIGLVLDSLIGDPVFAWHPVRLLGRGVAAVERGLFAYKLNGYAGGCILFLVTGLISLLVAAGFIAAGIHLHPLLGDLAGGVVVWATIALRDLIKHGERVARAVEIDDTFSARNAVSQLVGRDTTRMDATACGRATIESLAENLVDGVLSPLIYAILFGPLGAVIFKVVSTLDSMVGYKNERYLRFGWCGARTDDLLNYPVARLSWLLLGFIAVFIPGCNARKAWRVGLAQHGRVPGPNSGWPEATLAGALQRRLVGAIFKEGRLVANLWLGDPADPEGGTAADVRRSYRFLAGTTAMTFAAGALACWRFQSAFPLCE